MFKRIISTIICITLAVTALPVSAMAAEKENGSGNKYYLRNDYAESVEGIELDENRIDASTGSPQIKVSSSNTAKIVVQTRNLSEMTGATVTFAQNGGTLNVKLTALEQADNLNGTILAEKTISGGPNYNTRTSLLIKFTNFAPESASFMRVELTVSGSADGNSYVNDISLSKMPIVKLTSLLYKSSLESTGTENGDSVVANTAQETESQQWDIRSGGEKGWYYIVNVNSGKGIGLLGNSKTPGEETIQWTADGLPNQFWRFVMVEKNGNTYYKILNKNSNLVLTVNDDGIVTQEEYIAADNQLWAADIDLDDYGFASKYDDDYSISNIIASATDNIISYKAIHSAPESMYFEMVLSGQGNNQTSPKAEGTFTVTADGEYTLTASIYEDESKNVKVSEDLTKTFTIEDGEYSVNGADWTSSMEGNMWMDNGAIEVREVSDEDIEAIKKSGEDYILVDQNIRYQAMSANPWGGCFNERGWLAMDELTDTQKSEVVALLFGSGDDSLNLTSARTPIGSSDYGIEMYSYNETVDDYDMSEFDISQDDEYLIPFIREALKLVPDLPIFASPWTPPSWMKTSNRLYGGYIKDTEENFKAYAKYFVHYLKEYAKRGIDIAAVTPQNEPTMNTGYPSCVWNGDQLNVFLRDYLGGAINEYNESNDKDVELWLGTFTDSNQSMVWPSFKDPITSQMIDAYAFQWWGAPLASKLYSQSKAETGKAVKIVQSESKCGNGLNDWKYAEEQFDCFKEFLDAGVSEYYLWNMILEGRGRNNAIGSGWNQNSPISVNGTQVTLNPSFYQVKHFSSNIDAGARRIKVEGNNLGEGSVSGYVQDVRAIGFQNTDGEVVLNVKNSTASAKTFTVVVNDEAFDVSIPARSINTFTLDGEYEDTPDATEVVEVGETTNLKFASANTGDLLSAEGYANGDLIDTSSNKGESNQTWKLVKSTTDGYYHIVNFATDLGIAVWNGSTSEGAEIRQYENTGADDQKWKIEFVEYRGEGAERKPYYKLVNYKSQLVLTALGEDQDNLLTQMAFKNTDNQLWTLNIVGGEWQYPEDEAPVISGVENGETY